MRKFTGIDFMTESVPDETTLCKFRHLLEEKGNEWRFGMKSHIGVDAGSGLVHTMEVTAANVHDVTVASKLIREDDKVVYGDSGYLGIQKRAEVQDDAHLSAINYRINRRPHSLPKVSDNAIDWERQIEHRKSTVRCKVEHAFRIIKCQFGYTKPGIVASPKTEIGCTPCLHASISICLRWPGEGSRGLTRDRCAQIRKDGGNNGCLNVRFAIFMPPVVLVLLCLVCFARFVVFVQRFPRTVHEHDPGPDDAGGYGRRSLCHA